MTYFFLVLILAQLVAIGVFLIVIINKLDQIIHRRNQNER